VPLNATLFFENKFKHQIMLSFNPNLAAVMPGPAVCSFLKKTQKISCFSVTYIGHFFAKKNYKTDPP